MVCVAAFIVLCLIGIFVLIISIWKPEIGKRYLIIGLRKLPLQVPVVLLQQQSQYVLLNEQLEFY